MGVPLNHQKLKRLSIETHGTHFRKGPPPRIHNVPEVVEHSYPKPQYLAKTMISCNFPCNPLIYQLISCSILQRFWTMPLWQGGWHLPTLQEHRPAHEAAHDTARQLVSRVEKHSNWLDKLDKWGHLRKDDWDNLLQKKRLVLTFDSPRPGIWRIVFCEVRGWHKGHVCYATAEGQMTEDDRRHHCNMLKWWDWWIDHCNMNHISGYSWLEIPIPSMKFPWQHEWILVSPSFSARMEEVIFTRQ